MNKTRRHVSLIACTRTEISYDEKERTWPAFLSRLSLTAAWSLSVSDAMRKMSAGFHCSAGAVDGLRSYGNLYVPVSRCSSSVLNRLTMHVRCC